MTYSLVFERAFPERVRAARRRAELSQQALANSIGVRRTAVTQWERPGGTTPSVTNLIQAALAMKVTFEWLATGRGAMELHDDPVPAFSVECIARSGDEELLLSIFRALNLRQKEGLLEFLRPFQHDKKR